MKKLTITLVLALLLSANLFAAKLPTMLTKLEYDKFEKNLLLGIESENYGLKTSASYILGELRSSKSVIPLMSILHNGEEGARILAALSLYKIGEYKGIYAVKQAAKFDESERVRKQCEKFYYEYILEQGKTS